MYCSNCKVNYKEDIKECINCGESLSSGIVCIDCGTVNREKASVCNLCGYIFDRARKIVKNIERQKKNNLEMKEYKKICKNGHVNDINRIFCSECGSTLKYVHQKDIKKFAGNRWGILRSIINMIS
ncbi:MAG: double zinc ribbon domain-containing protein [Candidatus Muiribacteriota bacterium]